MYCAKQNNGDYMTSRPLVSIVIPAYNSEGFIGECLDSLVNQTYKHIQIIVVNDGSKDNTLSILNNYKDRGCIDTVIDKSNGGQSSARNAAFPFVSGEYVMFVDSDDMLAPHAVSRCIDEVIENDLDMVLFDADEFYDGMDKIEGKINTYNRPLSLYEKVVTGAELFALSVRSHQYNVSPCMYLFKKNFLDNIAFVEGITSEDNVFTTQLLTKDSMQKVKSIKDKLYIRRLREDSEVTRKKSMYTYTSYIRVFTELSSLKSGNYAKELNMFRSNILALATKCLPEIELEMKDEIKYRFNSLKMIIKYPSIISTRLLFTIFMPRVYIKVYSIFKKFLISSVS